MESTIVQLKGIFHEKIDIYKKFKDTLKSIDEIISDPALVYEDKHHELVEGLLSPVSRFIELNQQLEKVDSWRPTEQGKTTVFEKWHAEMTDRMKKEQAFLEQLFKPTLMEISHWKDYKESWRQNLQKFRDLVTIIRLDMTYFSLILQSYVKTAIYHIINLVSLQRYQEAVSYIEQQSSLLSRRESDLFRVIMGLAEEKNCDGALKALDEKGDVLEADELGLLRRVIEKIRAGKQDVISTLISLIRNGDYGHAHDALEENNDSLSRDEISVFSGVSDSLSRVDFTTAIDILKSNKNKVSEEIYKGLNDAIHYRFESYKKESRYKMLQAVCSHLLSKPIDLKKIDESIEFAGKWFQEAEISFLRGVQVHIGQYTFNIPINKLAEKKLFFDNERELLISTLTKLRDDHWNRINDEFAQFFRGVQAKISEREQKGGYIFDKESPPQKPTEEKPTRAGIFSRFRKKEKPKPEKVDMSRRRFLGQAAKGAAVLVGAAAGGKVLHNILKDTAPKKQQVTAQAAKPEPENIEEPPKSAEGIEPRFKDADLRRDINKIIKTEGSYRGAAYLAVIPHSSELDSLNAAKKACKGPYTYLAGNRERNILIRTTRGNVQLDPNAVFSNPNDADPEKGLALNFDRLNRGSWRSLPEGVRTEIRNAVNALTAEIQARVFRGKMVLALHQNYREGFGIRSYMDESRFSQYAGEVYENPSISGDNFAYVNTRAFFEFFKGIGYNVILQKNDYPNHDGSMSYAATWQSLPYVNIETARENSQTQAEIIQQLNEFIERYPQVAQDINYMPPEFAAPLFASSGKINVLIIGSDYLKKRAHLVSGQRADGLLAVNINRENKTIRILTIPRDTLVKIPGRPEEKDKINHALMFGGWQLQKDAVENFLKIRFDKVVFINQDQLMDVAHIVKEDLGYNIFAKIWWEVGLRDSKKLTENFNQEIYLASTDRSFKDAAIGRAKAHAKLAGAVIKVLAQSCREPEKSSIIMDINWIRNVLHWTGHTDYDFKPDELLFLLRELRGNEYKIALYCIPGTFYRAKYAHFLRLNKNGLSCWKPKEYTGDYFNSVTADSDSLIQEEILAA